MHLRALLVIVLLAVAHISARTMRVVRRDGAPAPLPPTVDPFYVPPSGWEKARPGAVLASRKITPGFTQSQKISLAAAYQLLYRTSGTSPDIPSYTVTTVLVPDGVQPNKLVMIMPYEDSNFLECAPSYKIQLGVQPDVNPLQTIEELMWTSVLNDGWMVTIPDHEGPLSAFSSGILEGHASLDALRATLAYSDLKLAPDSSIVGMGYSGGAIAGGWAASLHASYAPELNIAGWSIGGTPANVSAMLYSLDGGIYAGLSAAGLAGIVDSYPEANDYVGSVITHTGNTALQFTRENCMGDIIIGLRNANLLNASFVSNTDQFLHDPAIQGLMRKLTMGVDPTLTPKAPVYMYHSLHDEVIPFGVANKTAQLWCQHGANIEFQTYTGLEMGHVSTEVLNTPFVLKFIRDRMSGVTFAPGCQWTSTWNPLWQPDILGAKLTEVLNSISNFFGTAVGRGDFILKEKIQNGHF